MRTNWQEVTDLQQLRSACQSFEAALRAEQGIQFEDGYEVNVADLQRANHTTIRSAKA